MATGRADASLRIRARDETAPGFQSVNRRLQGLERSAGALASRLGGIGTAVGGLAVVATGVIAAQASALTNTLDKIDGLSQRTGIAAQTLSELRVAADLNKTSLDSLARGVQFLGTRLTDAAAGGKESGEIFRALGVEIKNADGSIRSADKVLEDLADRFAGYRDGAEKSTLAAKLFGRAVGPELIPFLNQGGRGIRSAREEAQRLGVSYGEDMTKAAAEFKDNLTRIGIAAEGLTFRYIGPLIRDLAVLSGRFVEAAKNGGLFFATIKTAGSITGSVSPFAFLEQRLARLIGVDLSPRVNLPALPGPSQGDLPAAPVIGSDPKEDPEIARRQRQAEAAARAAAQAAQSYLDNLRMQLRATEDLSVAETVLRDIQEGRLRLAGGVSQQELLNVARQIDAARERERVARAEEKAIEDLQRTREAASRQQQQAEQAAFQEVERLRDGNQALRDYVDEIGLTTQGLRELEQARLSNVIAAKQLEVITLQNGDASAAEVEAVRQQIALLQQRSQLLRDQAAAQDAVFAELRVQQSAQDAASVLARGAEDAIVNFRDLGSVIRSVEEDLVRLITRNLVTEPLFQSLKGFFEGVFRQGSGAGGAGGFLASLFGFAGGGIMTSAGPLALHSYKAGGVATRPQLALFGEGDKAEAFVPLPDGRSIPVTMTGGGGNTTNVNVTVHAPPGMDRRSASQIGVEVGRKIQQYMARA